MAASIGRSEQKYLIHAAGHASRIAASTASAGNRCPPDPPPANTIVKVESSRGSGTPCSADESTSVPPRINVGRQLAHDLAMLTRQIHFLEWIVANLIQLH